jgi:hypothetical protein
MAVVEDERAAPRSANSLCFYAGMHVCHKPLLRAFVGLLQSTIRRLYKKGGDCRAVLNLGLAVVRVHRVGGNSIADEMWLHLSFQNLTSWRAAVLPFVRDCNDVRCAAAAAGDRIAIELKESELPDLGVSTWWQAFDRHGIDFAPCWSVSVFEFFAAERNLPDVGEDLFLLRYQEIEDRPAATVEFWRGSAFHRSQARDRHVRRRSKRRRAADGGAPPGAAAPAEHEMEGPPVVPALQDADVDWDPSEDEEGGEHLPAMQAEEAAPIGYVHEDLDGPDDLDEFIDNVEYDAGVVEDALEELMDEYAAEDEDSGVYKKQFM